MCYLAGHRNDQRLFAALTSLKRPSTPPAADKQCWTEPPEQAVAIGDCKLVPACWVRSLPYSNPKLIACYAAPPCNKRTYRCQRAKHVEPVAHATDAKCSTTPANKATSIQTTDRFTVSVRIHGGPRSCDHPVAPVTSVEMQGGSALGVGSHLAPANTSTLRKCPILQIGHMPTSSLATRTITACAYSSAAWLTSIVDAWHLQHNPGRIKLPAFARRCQHPEVANAFAAAGQQMQHEATDELRPFQPVQAFATLLLSRRAP